MYPFSLYGRTIWIHRFRVTYQEELSWDPEVRPIEQIRYCNSRKQAADIAQRTGGTVTELDSSDYEWLDGIEVADVPDTYAEAVRIYEMGQEAYEAELAKPTPEEELEALKEHNAVLEAQLTDTQLALCDVYEAMTAALEVV